MVADITAIILTKNEEINIEDCIKSVLHIVKRVIVIDSFSTDRTVELAKSLGVEVIQNEFINHSKQYKFGVYAANIQTMWTFRIDADERMTTESAAELELLCKANIDTDVTGIVVRFKKNFLGKDLYHGGLYPWKKMIVYKTGKGDIEDRAMDEHIVVLEGRTVEMRSDSLHFDFKGLDFWINKHNWYSSKETADYFKEQETVTQEKQDLKTVIKMNFYYRLPMGLRSHLYYLYRYYVKLGFLDGKEGQIYAFLQAYWYRYLVDAKIYECEKNSIRYKGTGELK